MISGADEISPFGPSENRKNNALTIRNEAKNEVSELNRARKGSPFQSKKSSGRIMAGMESV